jgi:ABC-type nickel/cobalt efflux system permease component RcnA
MDRLTGGYDDRFGIFCVDDSISDFEIMDSSLILQYVLVLLIVAFACYSLFRVLKKNFAPKNSAPKEQTAIKTADVHNFLMWCNK